MEKILSRIRKLLELSKSANPHEAALAAERAAALMSEHQIEEATLRVAEPDRAAEQIETRHTMTDHANRKNPEGWHRILAQGVGPAFGCRHYYSGPRIILFGRVSACQAATYTFLYLTREIGRLAGIVAKAEGGAGKAWYHSFRLGAAQAVQSRLLVDVRAKAEAKRQAKAAQAQESSQESGQASWGLPSNLEAVQQRLAASVASCQALAIVDRDEQEVEAEYARFSRTFGGHTAHVRGGRSLDGLSAGQRAGASIALGGARASLGSGPRRIES